MMPPDGSQNDIEEETSAYLKKIVCRKFDLSSELGTFGIFLFFQ